MFRFSLLSALSAALIIYRAEAQTAGFEEPGIGPAGYYNGSDNTGGFSSGGLRFRNTYNPQFGSWSGFAVSSLTDSSTAGFANQYSVFAGTAASGQKFALGYASPEPARIVNTEPLSPRRLVSLKYTNATYPALSMKNGDAFSKKFGGPSGNDPDFFLLTVRSHRNGLITDSAALFLADYRFEDNVSDYIRKGWQTASLNFTQAFDSVSFSLTSSDVGVFGMNTPAYFCLDDVVTEAISAAEPFHRIPDFSIFPNPAGSQTTIAGTGGATSYMIVDSRGRTAGAGKLESRLVQQLDLSGLSPGCYRLVLGTGQWQTLIRR